LDDFLTDLDAKVVYALLKLIVSLDIQIFISSPCTSQVIEESLAKQSINFQEIIL
jgi:recombinational DNA repair ATPase RecF